MKIEHFQDNGGTSDIMYTCSGQWAVAAAQSAMHNHQGADAIQQLLTQIGPEVGGSNPAGL